MNFDAPDSFEPDVGVAAEVKNARIEGETEQSYVDYVMSVIVGRILPDIHDGLKPVHRHVLYAIHRAGVTSNSSHRKFSSIVSETMDGYHPHGDSVIYDTLARIAQDFSMRCPSIDDQGSFGSVDGDPPAAMHYTEAWMSPIAEEFLDDTDKDTIDFQSNHDDRKQEPTVLPSSFPNLFVSGSSGIAVGMSINIPPHNLGEIVDVIAELIENPDATVTDLMEHIRGPDLPTGANIVGRNTIHKAYKAGHGHVRVRADYDVFKEESHIVTSEFPYQENKARFIERIIDDVNEGKIEGTRNIRNEPDRDGTRVVIELKHGVITETIKNQLLDNHLESTFGVINLTLVDGQPRVLILKGTPEHYLDHHHDVVHQHSEYELAEAEDRVHIPGGRLKAPDDVDDVVKTIRNSESRDNTKAAFRGEIEVEIDGEPLPTFDFSEEQVSHVVSMQPDSPTSMEAAEIEAEYGDVQATIEHLKTILGDQSELGAVIESELLNIKDEYADDRRTSSVASTGEVTRANPILEEGVVVVVSEDDYVGRMPVFRFRDQHRGSKGTIGTDLRGGDDILSVSITNTHDDLLCFINYRQVY